MLEKKEFPILEFDSNPKAKIEPRNVILGQVLFGGDDLSGVDWDSRSWKSREDIRKNLVDISLEICLQL